MRFISATLLLGLALSNPAFADDKGDIHPGMRLIQSAAEAALWDETQPLHARRPGASAATGPSLIATGIVVALVAWGAMAAASSEA